MENKDNLIINLQKKLNDVFVNDYDLIKDALDDVNSYLHVMGVAYVFTYDIFCKDFLIMSQSFIDKITIEELNVLDTFVFVQEVIAIMIYYKIGETITNEDDKKFKILQHILIKKNT